MSFPPPRVCLFCEHFNIREGYPPYSEYTPGEEMKIECRKHWEFENPFKLADFRKLMNSAATCNDWAICQQEVRCYWMKTHTHVAFDNMTGEWHGIWRGTRAQFAVCKKRCGLCREAEGKRLPYTELFHEIAQRCNRYAKHAEVLGELPNAIPKWEPPPLAIGLAEMEKIRIEKDEQ